MLGLRQRDGLHRTLQPGIRRHQPDFRPSIKLLLSGRNDPETSRRQRRIISGCVDDPDLLPVVTVDDPDGLRLDGRSDGRTNGERASDRDGSIRVHNPNLLRLNCRGLDFLRLAQLDLK